MLYASIGRIFTTLLHAHSLAHNLHIYCRRSWTSFPGISNRCQPAVAPSQAHFNSQQLVESTCRQSAVAPSQVFFYSHQPVSLYHARVRAYALLLRVFTCIGGVAHLTTPHVVRSFEHCSPARSPCLCTGRCLLAPGARSPRPRVPRPVRPCVPPRHPVRMLSAHCCDQFPPSRR